MNDFELVPMVSPGTANVRLTDPITSHEAMDSHASRAQVEAFVLALFARFGPMTDEELRERYFAAENHPPAHPDSPRKRRSDLTSKGELIDMGKRRGKSKRRMVAWGIPMPFPPVPAVRAVA